MGDRYFKTRNLIVSIFLYRIYSIEVMSELKYKTKSFAMSENHVVPRTNYPDIWAMICATKDIVQRKSSAKCLFWQSPSGMLNWKCNAQRVAPMPLSRPYHRHCCRTATGTARCACVLVWWVPWGSSVHICAHPVSAKNAERTIRMHHAEAGIDTPFPQLNIGCHSRGGAFHSMNTEAIFSVYACMPLPHRKTWCIFDTNPG